eukprot:GHRQ01029671.1.p1 GENE.GHRQ01029671.1~~GHRQ01029671.1.p1  ORF type:complete len:146 (-),score=9.85 GHRQ01029671.1:35-472(-)
MRMVFSGTTHCPLLAAAVVASALAHRHRLGGASVTHDKHTTNVWVNHVKQQRQLHLLLALNSDEGERQLLLSGASLDSSGCPAYGQLAVCHMLLLTPVGGTLLQAPLQLHCCSFSYEVCFASLQEQLMRSNSRSSLAHCRFISIS